jgi:flagellar protein FlgJ
MNIHALNAAAPLQATPGADNPKLKSAAHEFEASLMKEFLKPLEHDSLFSEDRSGDSDDQEGSAGALMSFGSQAMAQAISERGGFGIATKILDHFKTGSPVSVAIKAGHSQ